MLAQHPLTGKPIRVVKCSAQLWRDAKTLVLLNDHSDTGIAWDRWETCAAGLQRVQSLRKKGVPIHIPIFLDEPGFTFEDLERESQMSHLVVVSMKVIQEIGSEAFKEGKLRNIVCLDEFIHLYSYCGEAWNGTLDDAVILLSMILKYSRVAGISSEGLDIQARKDRIEAMKIKLLGLDAKPPALWLIQQYFRPDKTKRAREIKRCLEENVRCSYVDKILLLNEADYSADFPKGSSDKIIQKVVGKRLTYEMVIREIFESVPQGVIAVFSNSDIFLENTTRLLWSVSMDDRFLSLLRWDVPEGAGESKMFGPRDDSQDTWIVSSDSVKQRKWKWDDLAFPFGKNGCDNAINVEMLRQKFLISNPAYSIKTQHVHSSGYRTYNPQDIVDKPVYLHIAPTGLNDMNAKETFDATTILKKVNHKTFDRAIQSIQEKEIKTFCNMLRRNETYDYLYGSKNNFTQDADMILGLKDSFCTPNGLPYGHHELYVGNTARSKELWSSTGIAGCQPTIETDLGIIAPLTEKEVGSQEDFCLKYLAKIMQIRTLGGEFLCPKENSLIDVLRLFRWDSTNVPVIEQTPNSSVYYKNAVIWTPSDKDSRTKEDIDALRSHLFVPWLGQVPKSKKITIIEDGELLDSNWVAALEDVIGDSYDIHVVWPGRTSLERILTVLRDTEILIYANSETTLKTWSWMWLLPEGAHCIELQNEMDPRGDSIHLAGASQLDLWLIIMRKGIKEHMRRDTVGLVCKTLQNGIFNSELKKSDLPIVWLPRGDIQGFYGHTGDSFREMVRMWGERGLCQVKEHPVATLCWWDDVGSGCLLYDRPNLDWFYNAPPLEQTWKKALFGNPEPLSGGKAWSFWPRRPRLVEDIVAKGLPTRGFYERHCNLVFYGKVENRVQEKRRTTADWIEICDEFIMPKGDDSKYPFTQEEYLVKLTEAKYGLCLAGYGRKCHREVECMAMGCVPVVEKEVDISSYANPPVEGVHYLRITEPSLLDAQLASISEEHWTKMSLACRTWWRENVSCEGMFALTKKLVDVA